MRRFVMPRRFASAFAALAVALGATLVTSAATATNAAATNPAKPSGPTCDLGNGVKHVVYLNFDNVHFFRDNPNVPSDLELMPHLLQFLESNGTMLSNNHTPLIAHTTDDILTSYTGLYGDRHGVGISNDYNTYNADGTTDPANAFAYWTDPIFDTASTPNPGHDTNPNMVYSSKPPATSNPAPTPTVNTPAPWVPFTRAGCDVGNVATANMVLENTAVDFPKVFGPNSPENQQLQADTDSFKDAETADYVGLGVHCAQGSTFCSAATGVKFGQTAATPTASPDLLPDEPGGYNGYQALFGHRYVAPQLIARDGSAVTNGAGNLVDLSGNQINGAFLSNHPGFPGFSHINASQTLAYMADMQEAGIPVTYGYISDIHGNEHIPGVTACNGAPSALGSGSACYIAQAQAYDQSFAQFFTRLASDGITPANTLFMITADEGDHEAGANVGRAIQPTPANCDGATVSGTTVTPDVPCTYPAGSFGELSGNVTGLLATEKGNTTPFSLETDTAPNFYLTGNPGPTTPVVRQFERDVSGLTANNPYTGGTQPVANWLADPTEEAILHFVNADPARTPTFTMFAKPDYFFSPGSATCPAAGCVTQNSGFAWDHGDYAPEINTTWLGVVGPDVKHLGLDGLGPSQGPNSAGPNSGQGTIPGSGTTGTWMDHTDIRPTLMYLTGLTDDYQHDGTVVTDILGNPNSALRHTNSALGQCYKQLNSSVGEFGTATLQADTAAIESNSTNDQTYTTTASALRWLETIRDSLAQSVKSELEGAAFNNQTPNALAAGFQTLACHITIAAAEQIANG
jgi:hypothetical protein